MNHKRCISDLTAFDIVEHFFFTFMMPLIIIIIIIVYLFTCNCRCSEVGMYTIYPWVLQTCNNYSNSDQLSVVKVPDTNPSDIPVLGLFSMAAGDFLEVYSVSGIVLCNSLFD